MRWISSRISAFDGSSDGLTQPRQMRRAAFIFARKYSVSLREYIIRAAATIIPRLSFSSVIQRVPEMIRVSSMTRGQPSRSDKPQLVALPIKADTGQAAQLYAIRLRRGSAFA